MNLLVIRMSAMGDVALTLPAIRSVLDHYPDLTITLVTRRQFLPFFENIDRLNGVAADVTGRHKGLGGLWRLYRELRKVHTLGGVIDLHDVLRSRILSLFFRLEHKPVYRINKGRQEKKRLTARSHKRLTPLTHAIERYLDTFKRAGFPANLSNYPNWFSGTVTPESFLRRGELSVKKGPWIGIAPFAKHREKRWPLEKTEALISALDRAGIRMFLFGGGPDETACLQAFANQYPLAVVVAGHLALSEELGLMAQLDLMVSMDSANMHLAALTGIPVISIWGATHPYAGFGPIGNNEQRIVQIPVERLGCRPCSVFGNKPCYRGDHACMEWIAPGDVIHKISQVLEGFADREK